jgi:hypothetical protein
LIIGISTVLAVAAAATAIGLSVRGAGDAGLDGDAGWSPSAGHSAAGQASASVANWIQTSAQDTRGPGGYTGGIDDANTKIMWKSTEHNLDIYGFFTMLAEQTGDPVWTGRAQRARGFAVAMYDASKHVFWIGTDEDGRSIDNYLIPEDTQSWSYLALRDPKYSGSIDYAIANLSATDGAFTGVSFGNADRSKVWFEGTAHIAAALLQRKGPGDVAKAQSYLDCIARAQATAPNHDGKGIVSASRDGLQTGDGPDEYYASLHTGATSLYLLALRQADPFVL